jgi:hypothetical protein
VTYCDTCGIDHETEEEATAIHEAVRRVRDWLRERVNLALRPLVIGKRTRNPKGWGMHA